VNEQGDKRGSVQIQLTKEELKLLKQGRTSTVVDKVAERARTMSLPENKAELDKVV
jgi:hypothetical protein